MHNVQIAGETAVVRWGYYTAVTLSAWSIAMCDGGWALRSTVRTFDALRVSQRPLIVFTRGGRWRVQPDTLQISDSTLTAMLSPDEG